MRRYKCDQEKAKRILEYKDLIMWNIKTEVIPVINGAAGTISK